MHESPPGTQRLAGAWLFFFFFFFLGMTLDALCVSIKIIKGSCTSREARAAGTLSVVLMNRLRPAFLKPHEGVQLCGPF